MVGRLRPVAEIAEIAEIAEHEECDAFEKGNATGLRRRYTELRF